MNFDGEGVAHELRPATPDPEEYPPIRVQTMVFIAVSCALLFLAALLVIGCGGVGRSTDPDDVPTWRVTDPSKAGHTSMTTRPL